MGEVIEILYGLLSDFFVQKNVDETLRQRFTRAILGVLIFLVFFFLIVFCIVYFNKNT